MQMPGTLLLARVAIGDPYYTPGPYQGSRAFSKTKDIFPLLLKMKTSPPRTNCFIN